MKNSLLFSIYIALSSLLLVSCDPESCRICPRFYFNLSQWSLIDQTLPESYVMLDEDRNRYVFELIESSSSEPYEACALAESPDDVFCQMWRSFTYRCDTLDLEVSSRYFHSEILSNQFGSTVDQTLSFRQGGQTYQFRIDISDVNLTETPPNIFNNIGEYSLVGQTFEEAEEIDIRFMTDQNFRSLDSPRVFRRIIRSTPAGIVGYELEDGKMLILDRGM